MTSTAALKPAIDKVLVEKRALKIEEKALNETLAKLKAQLTQLQVEALEIRARARQQKQEPASEYNLDERLHHRGHSRSTRQRDFSSGPTSSTATQNPENINEQELELAVVDPQAILQKMMAGQFEMEDDFEEEEEDDDDDP
ncbi:hypothetical protein TCAL_00791 [Tigriopus californicus]|uniref:Uncharacterized protein n=2 Tax=Tigriopus californicus TaxID=6832 RepID=A0A553NCC5_TIGCA|nr:hypothetical protein TCAL_00791 [Tigriopus californicus]